MDRLEHVPVTYSRDARHAGSTKYPLRKLFTLGLDGVVGFSHIPLRLALILGFIVAFAAFALGLVELALRLFGTVSYSHLPGWATIIVVLSFLGGIQLILIGTLGIYVGRIYEEVKDRPLYVVRDLHGLGRGGDRTALSGEERYSRPRGRAVIPATLERSNTTQRERNAMLPAAWKYDWLTPISRPAVAAPSVAGSLRSR